MKNTGRETWEKKGGLLAGERGTAAVRSDRFVPLRTKRHGQKAACTGKVQAASRDRRLQRPMGSPGGERGAAHGRTFTVRRTVPYSRLADDIAKLEKGTFAGGTSPRGVSESTRGKGSWRQAS